MGLVNIDAVSLGFLDQDTLENQDFALGLFVEEILDTGVGLSAQLIGNMMPYQPLNLGGTQQIVKEYYSGNDEPAVQILGPREDDIVFRGRIHEKKVSKTQKFNRRKLAQAMVDIIDDMRKRGNLVQIRLGEMERYGYISSTKFGMRNLGDFEYEFTFSHISFQLPTKCPQLERSLQFPDVLNQALADYFADLEEARQDLPPSVGLGIADLLNTVIGGVADVLHEVTSFVDDVLSVAEDITASISRAVGLVTYAKTKVHEYSARLAMIDMQLELAGIKTEADNPYSNSDIGYEDSLEGQKTTDLYTNARFVTRQQKTFNDVIKTLEEMRQRFLNYNITIPLARHLVKDDETLQTISVKYYGTVDNWNLLYRHNGLTSTVLTPSTVLEIPKD